MPSHGSRDVPARSIGGPSVPEEVPDRGSLRPRTLRLGADDASAAPLADELARLASARRSLIPEEEDEDALETVLESHWGDAAPLDQLLTEERWSVPTPGLTDPHTVWRDRMPLAFITESVIDDGTVEDPGSDARRWREQEVYELNTAMPRQDVPAPAPAPAVAPQPSPPPSPTVTPHGPPPPPPIGVRTLTPPVGVPDRGLPRLAEWDGSMSPSPPYRFVAPHRAQGESPVTSAPTPTALSSLWEAHVPAVVGGAAVGVLLGAVYVLLRLL